MPLRILLIDEHFNWPVPAYFFTFFLFIVKQFETLEMPNDKKKRKLDKK